MTPLSERQKPAEDLVKQESAGSALLPLDSRSVRPMGFCYALYRL